VSHALDAHFSWARFARTAGTIPQERERDPPQVQIVAYLMTKCYIPADDCAIFTRKRSKTHFPRLPIF
jgi:hypothetical protein